MQFKVKLFSKDGLSQSVVQGRVVHEELRRIGLEWKTADQFHDQTVVLVVEPYEPTDHEDIKGRVRLAAEALEGTGLL